MLMVEIAAGVFLGGLALGLAYILFIMSSMRLEERGAARRMCPNCLHKWDARDALGLFDAQCPRCGRTPNVYGRRSLYPHMPVPEPYEGDDPKEVAARERKRRLENRKRWAKEKLFGLTWLVAAGVAWLGVPLVAVWLLRPLGKSDGAVFLLVLMTAVIVSAMALRRFSMVQRYKRWLGLEAEASDG